MTEEYITPLRRRMIEDMTATSARGLVTPLRACGPAGGSVATGMKKIGVVTFVGFTCQ
jgi:hypothetical protein